MNNGDDKVLALMLRQVRCDGHFFHISASIALTRAAVQSAICSGATMLRTSDYMLVLRSKLFDMVGPELDFDDSLTVEPNDSD